MTDQQKPIETTAPVVPATPATPVEPATPAAPASPKISIDDLAKVEISVGQIKTAEKVPNADRLLRLTVDFGTEVRQIVSGIAEYYTPEQIIGKKCPFITNLQPRVIKGLESNGMILAAKDTAGNFSLLDVDQKILPGTKLS